MPDTNILIEIRAQLDHLEQGAGFITGPLWSSRSGPTDALSDLVQLWWWRDVRFVVSSIHLVDSRKSLNEDRKRARWAAVEELERDYFERGGSETVVADDAPVEDEPCAIHAIPLWAFATGGSSKTSGLRWPRGKLDRRLTRAAHDQGCHVFLTMDKDILRSRPFLFPRGLAILTPTLLMEALDESGELDEDLGEGLLLPDISALSRLYGGFAGA